MKILSFLWVMLLRQIYALESTEHIMGLDFYNGIQRIIGKDPNVPVVEIPVKPFVGSFANVHSIDDNDIETVMYCFTDKPCNNHFDAYSRTDIPLAELDCNEFCYIDSADSDTFSPSKIYTAHNPPLFYLNCGWETCN
jgi:hypothetical protein